MGLFDGGFDFNPGKLINEGLGWLGLKNPSGEASPYLEKIAPMLEQYLKPYMDRGESQYDNLNKQYGAMGSDPAAYLESLMKGYAPSQGYGLQRDEALKAAGNSAAAGGMRGSINDINNQANITNSLLGKDMQQWLSNVMGVQGRGLQGQQGLYDTGYNAAQGYSSDLSNVYGSQAKNAYQGQANQNDTLSSIYKSLLGFGGSFF